MTVLFRLAQWHALAKLRVHTEFTLDALGKITSVVGRDLRKFRDTTCAAFNTVELPCEAAARRRRKDSDKAKNPSSAKTAKTRTTKKIFNLLTYKFHALGDYLDTIRSFGTTDSYTTQIVCTSCIPSLFAPHASLGGTRPSIGETAVWANEQTPGHQTDRKTRAAQGSFATSCRVSENCSREARGTLPPRRYVRLRSASADKPGYASPHLGVPKLCPQHLLHDA
jgi:hypothetical protein